MIGRTQGGLKHGENGLKQYRIEVLEGRVSHVPDWTIYTYLINNVLAEMAIIVKWDQLDARTVAVPGVSIIHRLKLQCRWLPVVYDYARVGWGRTGGP